jgi:CRP-like cAMP-binding protein
MGPVFPSDAGSFERSHWMNTFANMRLLEKASSATLEAMTAHAVFQRYAPNVLIFDEREPALFVFFILDGVARVYQGHDNGAQYTPKIFRAPTHFGDLGALAGLGQYRSSVEAITACVVARVPIEIAEQCLAVDHGLALSWLYSVARQHSCTIDLDRQNVFGTLTTRLANVLLSYGEVFGVRTGTMHLIDHALSYTKLAQQVGCHRRNAIAAIKRMVERKLVTTTSDGMMIDAQRLLAEVLPNRLSLAHSLHDVRGSR